MRISTNPCLHLYSCATLTGRKRTHTTASDHRLHPHSSSSAETSQQPSIDLKTKPLHPQGHNHAGNSSAQRNPHEQAGGEELCLLAAGPFITEQGGRKKATPSIAPPSRSSPIPPPSDLLRGTVGAGRASKPGCTQKALHGSKYIPLP